MKKLLLLFFTPCLALASFDENTRRYLSGPELMWSIARVIPRSMNYALNADECHAIDEKNSSPFGVSEPALGEPLSPHPHTGTIQWIQACVERYFSFQPLLYAPWKDVKLFLGENFWTLLRKNSKFKDYFVDEENWKQINQTLGGWLFLHRWQQFSAEEKSAMISGLIFSVLGPDEIIADFGFTTREKLQAALIRRLDQMPDLHLSDAMKIVTINLILREEFLSY